MWTESDFSTSGEATKNLVDSAFDLDKTLLQPLLDEMEVKLGRPPKSVKIWDEIKAAYIERTEAPSFAELAKEFSVLPQDISKRARDQGWVTLRVRRSGQILERSGAHEMLINAAATQKAVTDKISDAALVLVERIQETVEELQESNPQGKKLAPSTKIGIYNDISFTLSNIARALKDAGVIGLPRALMNELEEKTPTKGSKEYIANALHQINVTVNLAKKGKDAADTPQEKTAETLVTGDVLQTRIPGGGFHAINAEREKQGLPPLNWDTMQPEDDDGVL